MEDRLLDSANDLIEFLKNHPATSINILKRISPLQLINRFHTKTETPADSFVLGYYLPWLLVARSVDDSELSEKPELISDIDTMECYMLEAADKLKLGIDKEYIYNIRYRPITETYSLSKKLSETHGEPEVLSTFHLGYSLSESVIVFDDEGLRTECFTVAAKCAKQIGLGENINGLLRSDLKESDKSGFEENVNKFAIDFIDK